MAKKDKQSGSKVWSLMSLVAVIGAAAVAKKALHTGWKTATGKNPPTPPTPTST